MPNIAAIMRTDVKAVDVRFSSTKSSIYRYLTTFTVAVDDFVIVPLTDETFKVTKVCAVKPAELDPNDELTYKYIVHAFTLDAYNKLLTENEEIERLIAVSQRASMRNAFANAVLANVDTDTRARLELLTNNQPNLDI
mgnify:CR=1 FL=1